MNKCKVFSKMWFLPLLLVAFVAGCANNDQEITKIPVLPDITAPVVSFTSPAPGDVAVPYDRKVSVAFSEAMNPSTITTSTFTLTGPGSTPVAGAVSPVGPSATFTPSSNLAVSTTYTATITTGVKDLAGNALASPYVWSFTTGAAPDTIAPTVSVTSPTNTAVAVPLNRVVHVGFSEAMDPSTVNTVSFTVTITGGAKVQGTVIPVGTSAAFAPSSSTPLVANTSYTATIKSGINGVKDLAGNAMASDFVFTFTTGAAADLTAPTVSLTSPTDTAIAVPTNRIVHIGFSEVMDTLSLNSATITMRETVSTTNVPGTVTSVGTSATFSSNAPLFANTKYSVTILSGNDGVKDLAGNAMASNFVFTFTTGAVTDTTKPTVIRTINANGATGVSINTKVGATFSEVMDASTITSGSFTFKLNQGAIPVPGLVTYSGVDAVFTPATPLTANTTYTATITTAAKDLAGNPLAGNQALPPAASNYVWSFTTGAAADTAKPTVVSTNPANLATGVAVNSSVNATFSKAMDPLTISTATFTVAGVTGTVTYDAASKIATFAHAANLAANTTYTATITTGAADLANNALATDYVWSFTTANVIVPPPAALINLGSAGTFGIMATSAITNTGAATRINGDVSLDPGTSNGLLPVQVNGTIHINDTVSAQARIDLLAAYNSAKALAPGVTVPGGMDLGAFPNGGLPGVLPPGTYTSGSTMLISTPLTLDGKGDANASWVFQIGSSLTSTNSVTLINGAQAKNVYWVPTASATVGVGTIFNGNIIAGVSATGQTGAVINGRILAGATNPGTIALDTNTVNVPAP
ncbi:MAG TPA: Ig-like domain-containing protein [Dongiaceae bacterium]|nr:Ig-like domain-containing protein [Dongiaceae bacterium]